MLRLTILILSVVVVLPFPISLSAQQRGADRHAPWGYSGAEGPEHWGDLDPDYAACKTGTQQSPIDIEGARSADLPPIHFDYQVSPLKVTNNGHTIQVNYDPGSTMTVGDKQYSLVQFHFHHPSEEEINGKRFDLAAHLVHKDAQGHFAVLTVLFQSGQTNPFLALLWKNVPKETGKEVANKKINLNVADLLPANRRYYAFTGSLTAPPCTEGVTWYVLENPVELSPSEIDAFAKWYPDNARPIQPRNGREILKSSK
ncbi:MAG TPA: carbonic anhydrase [Candidatus Acidoferrum sp.]|nr:carbonic anhydrase [Candidatus Acidoferrum sp.]